MRTGFLALASGFFSLFLLESAFAFSEERADSNFLSGSNDFIEDLFYKITLGGEVKHLRNTKILKWKGQWKVLIVGDIGDKVIEIVDEQMIFLSQMTNIKYIKMARISESNVIIIFPKRSEIDGLAHNLINIDEKYKIIKNIIRDSRNTDPNLEDSCFRQVFFDEKSWIYKSLIVIPYDGFDDQVEYCIIEELSQMTGLLNDTEEFEVTIFNDSNNINYLTDTDKFLLNILYDERISAGAEIDFLKDIVPEIIEDLRGEVEKK